MMEMGALTLGSGAVVGGVFGMNLVSGLEEHPQGEFNKPVSSSDNKRKLLFMRIIWNMNPQRGFD